MTGTELWDYSLVPERTWQWYLDEQGDHWIDLNVISDGLQYLGTDWTCQSGGGYFAGFQSFDEFFQKGPIKDMPEEIRIEVTEFLIAHRNPSGTGLRLVFANMTEIPLTRAYVHLNDNPIRIQANLIVSREEEVVFFHGSLPKGEHSISFLLVFEFEENQTPHLFKVDGDFTLEIQDVILDLKLVAGFENDQIIVRITELNE